MRILFLSALAILLIVPSVFWAFSDQTAWWWDQARYAADSVDLWYAPPSAWPVAMLHAVGFAPPLIAWIAQFFVPLRHITGSTESALLLFNVFGSALTLLLICQIVLSMGGRTIDAAAAMIACGGAGIFIALTHQFLVEMTQGTTVACLMAATWRVERRSWAAAIGLMLLAATAAMLSKTSSITFILPLVLYAAISVGATWSRKRPNPTAAGWIILCAGLIVLYLGAAWFLINWGAVTAHFRAATAGDVALHYGAPVELGRKLSFWTHWLAKSLTPSELFSSALGILILTAVVLSTLRLLRSGFRDIVARSIDDGTLFALALVGMVCATVLMFSLQVNEDTRFLISTTPMVATLIGWALSRFTLTWLSAAVACYLAICGAFTHARAFSYNPMGWTFFNYLLDISYDRSDKEFLNKIVALTCDGPGWIVLGVNYASINANSADFFAAKRRRRVCSYANLSETDVEQGLQRVISISPRYVVTIPVDRQVVSDNGKAPDFVNSIARPLAERLMDDKRFVRDPKSDDSLTIYRMMPATR
jgi:4-amino-4-deoxy-L-arabinose transferase-like glycosyltransferase